MDDLKTYDTNDYADDQLGADTDNHDHTDGLTLQQFETFMTEIRLQPNWRKESDKACEYYDGNQFDSETMERFRDIGMGAVYENLIKQPVNLMLGMEAKSRTDWRVNSDGEDFTEVAEALSQKLFEAERETRADRACADAYAPQVKAGIGFVEVSRESDPFKYKYRVKSVHRNEIAWDWTAKEADLSDAKYMVRRRWMDIDQATRFFPKQEHLIRAAANADWGTFNSMMLEDSALLNRAFEQEQRTTIQSYEWRDTINRRCCIFECWYKTYVTGIVMRLPDGRTIEADMENPKHLQLISSGQVKAFKANFTKMRMTWWLGCHKLYEGETPYRHNDYPYVPFFGFREDLTGVPYGMVRDLIPLQDEVNARRAKMMLLLSAKRVIRTSGIVKDVALMREEIARPDADIELNEKAVREGGRFEVQSDQNLSQQQFQVMNDTREAINRVSSVFSPALGENTGQSGLAINSLVEQSATTLAELNDNFRFSRRKVGELLLELIREEIDGEQTVVAVGEDSPKQIVLNQVIEENGIPSLINDTSNALVKVALEDVASSPAYRIQQQAFFTDAMKSAPPQVQAVLLPYYFEVSELPNRKEIVKQIRTMLGLADANAEADPMQMKYEETINQLQMQMQEMQMQLNDKQADRDAMLEATDKRVEGAIALQQEKNSEALKEANDSIKDLTDKLGFLSNFIDGMKAQDEQTKDITQ